VEAAAKDIVRDLEEKSGESLQRFLK